MRERIMRVLQSVNPKFDKHWDVDFLEEGLIDSFEIMNIIMELEQEFAVEIDPELILPENFCSLEAMETLIGQIVGK